MGKQEKAQQNARKSGIHRNYLFEWVKKAGC